MLVGLQTEVDKNECDNKDVQSNVMANSTVERTVVSTYGTFLAESLAEWSEQVLDLGNSNQNYIRFQRSAKLCRLIIIVQSGKFDGRVIQRELSMITNLMTEDNFEGVMKDDGKPLNVTRARVWFEVGLGCVMVAVPRYPMMLQDYLLNKYCEVFNATCALTGCGVDDSCQVEEWCSTKGGEISLHFTLCLE